MAMTPVDPVIIYLLTGSLSLLWASAAVHKLQPTSDFRATIVGYDLLPVRMASLVAVVLPLMEIATSVGLWLATPYFAVSSIFLFLLYSVAIGVNLTRGRRDLDCGCGGPALNQKISNGLIYRNVALAFATLLLVLPMGSRSLDWGDACTIVAGILVVSLLYAATDQLLAISGAHGLNRASS
jgi:hypothetical protein